MVVKKRLFSNNYSYSSGCKGQGGFTVLELVATLGLMVIITGIAVANLREFSNPLQNGAAELSSFVKQMRGQAIASTSAYIIKASSSSQVITQRARNCADTSPVTDPLRSLAMPTGATFYNSTWSICFNSRGLPDANLEIDLRDTDNQSKIVEILLGGSVRTI